MIMKIEFHMKYKNSDLQEIILIYREQVFISDLISRINMK